MTYFKINSVYKRHQSGNRELKIGDFACEEFDNIKWWSVDEKVDGTNIRVIYAGDKIVFGGRTDAANLPAHLVSFLQNTFTIDKLRELFPKNEDGTFPSVVIYGEGYGPKIQEPIGSNYRSDVSFVGFDIKVGNWWLQKYHVKNILLKMGVDMVPDLGMMNLEQIFEFVKSKPLSQISNVPQMMEGVVCRPIYPMLFRNQNPIIFKLKCKDLIKGSYGQENEKSDPENSESGKNSEEI